MISLFVTIIAVLSMHDQLKPLVGCAGFDRIQNEHVHGSLVARLHVYTASCSSTHLRAHRARARARINTKKSPRCTATLYNYKRAAYAYI